MARIGSVFSTNVSERLANRLRRQGIDANRFEQKECNWNAQRKRPDPQKDLADCDLTGVHSICLDTPQRTAEFALQWFLDENSCIAESSLLTDPKHLQLVNEASFEPWTLQIRIIKMDDNLGPNNKGIGFVSNQESPGIDLLLLGAQNPERIRAIALGTHCGFWIPGLVCNTATTSRWSHFPMVHKKPDEEKAVLAPIADSYVLSEISAPIYLL